MRLWSVEVTDTENQDEDIGSCHLYIMCRDNEGEVWDCADIEGYHIVRGDLLWQSETV